jgi:hypothetical protein
VGGWQIGALNESLSDSFSEIVDELNVTDSDFPNTLRQPNACSTVVDSDPQASLDVIAPEALQRGYVAGPALFNPVPPFSVSAALELADDGRGEASDACHDLIGFTPGRIAVIYRGECLLIDKVRRAEAAGAVGAIVINVGTDEVFTMSGSGTLGIPSVVIGSSDGDAIKAALQQGVTATLSRSAITDDSVRWLQAEDTVFNGVRDLWNPGCFGDPGRVLDGKYWCSAVDQGGVHANAGVPNHGFALIVDGGSYNGRTISGIGTTKAAHIYWRAMSVHQVSYTDFAIHADALELSCQELIGVELSGLESGPPSGEHITGSDCVQVAESMLAIEARAIPTQCKFPPILASDPPQLGAVSVSYSNSFDEDPGSEWTLGNEGVHTEYVPRDWQVDHRSARGRRGRRLLRPQQRGDR